ncbi:hypothetical protein BHE90_016589 [Fusarium euwallaceae]|uniref:Uncharacterized protein n=1 Tax=Fusarium euwallaceae TaxID=1147111 RepID=A0A430KZY7_9HYPO|nr:hypothetical protein BHE90_016589 [Fusarium euwallaceae]
MGRSSKPNRSHKEEKSKKGRRTKPDKRTRSSHSATTELREVIADLEQRQQSLAREWQDHTYLQATAVELQTRLRESQETQQLLSSSSLAAQQRRGVSQFSDDPSHQIYNQSNRHQHLAREIDAMRDSIAEFQQRADAVWEVILRHQEEIEELQRRINELRDASAGDEHGQGWGEGLGYPDDDDDDEPQGGYSRGVARSMPHINNDLADMDAETTGEPAFTTGNRHATAGCYAL